MKNGWVFRIFKLYCLGNFFPKSSEKTWICTFVLCFLIQKCFFCFWINESSCNKKKETDAIMKLFLFFIISTWTNGSFVTNFSKQYSMRSNVSIKHVFLDRFKHVYSWQELWCFKESTTGFLSDFRCRFFVFFRCSVSTKKLRKKQINCLFY